MQPEECALAFRQDCAGEKLDTLVVKTLAILPEVSGHGLGSLLSSEVYARAKALGMHRYYIHAMMHEANLARRISARYAMPMRRYSMFVKEL